MGHGAGWLAGASLRHGPSWLAGACAEEGTAGVAHEGRTAGVAHDAAGVTRIQKCHEFSCLGMGGLIGAYLVGATWVFVMQQIRA